MAASSSSSSSSQRPAARPPQLYHRGPFINEGDAARLHISQLASAANASQSAAASSSSSSSSAAASSSSSSSLRQLSQTPRDINRRMAREIKNDAADKLPRMRCSEAGCDKRFRDHYEMTRHVKHCNFRPAASSSSSSSSQNEDEDMFGGNDDGDGEDGSESSSESSSDDESM